MIFDTDILIWGFRGDSNAAKVVDSCADRAASIISLMEMLQGAKSKSELKLIRIFLRDLGFQVIPVSEAISQLAATLIEEHTLSYGLQLADAMIAATARETGSDLVTGNVRHFRAIPQLELKPFRPAARG